MKNISMMLLTIITLASSLQITANSNVDCRRWHNRHRKPCREEREESRGLVGTVLSPVTDPFEPVTAPVSGAADGTDHLLRDIF
jgi:hypothetical protein